ncbi:MAG: glycosyltransferase [Candidatus Dadabacteria bacterium]|nr:MAG: glycosyltransferase [Candidatus Dadabacteria bacterium]
MDEQVRHIDVVIPVFNEEEIIETLYQRTSAALDGMTGWSWRMILVNDGSSDTTWALIEQLHARDPRVVGVDLARNFGHQPAILAGLEQANADIVVTMDGDLQDPPELIPQLVAPIVAGECDIATAMRRSRKERGIRGFLLRAFHKLFKWISDFPIDEETGTYCAMSRRAHDHFVALQERNRFFPGLRAWVGFEHTMVEYDRDERLGGEPKQTMARLFRYAFDAIFSFSYKPLRLIFFAGTAVFVTGLALAAWFLARRLSGVETAEQGFTTLVTLILVFGGSNLMAIGVLGQYLGRIYDEVKHRPHYIVRTVLDQPTEQDA